MSDERTTETARPKNASDSKVIRELIDQYPLSSDRIPWNRDIKIGVNTALLCVVGSVAYARGTTAQWMWSELSSGSMWHEFSVETGHKVAVLADRLPSIIRTMTMAGKQVLIV